MASSSSFALASAEPTPAASADVPASALLEDHAGKEMASGDDDRATREAALTSGPRR